MKNFSSQLTLIIRVSVFILLALSLEIIQAQRTVTRTEIVTRITTVTVTRNFVCAKLVNVTSACRRSRGIFIDEPIILTFDEELEETIDEAFHRVLLHPQFVPSRTLGVEVTPLVMFPTAMQWPNDNIQLHSFNNYYQHHPRVPPSPMINVVQPSIRSDTRYAGVAGRNKIGAGNNNPEPRLYFSQINALFNAIFNNLFRPRLSVTVTITNFISQTRSVTVGGTTSTTFFVMRCIPSPFPFPTCPSSRRSRQLLIQP